MSRADGRRTTAADVTAVAAVRIVAGRIIPMYMNKATIEPRADRQQVSYFGVGVKEKKEEK